MEKEFIFNVILVPYSDSINKISSFIKLLKIKLCSSKFLSINEFQTSPQKSVGSLYTTLNILT